MTMGAAPELPVRCLGRYGFCYFESADDGGVAGSHYTRETSLAGASLASS
jgi:hypothetical protein